MSFDEVRPAGRRLFENMTTAVLGPRFGRVGRRRAIVDAGQGDIDAASLGTGPLTLGRGHRHSAREVGDAAGLGDADAQDRHADLDLLVGRGPGIPAPPRPNSLLGNDS